MRGLGKIDLQTLQRYTNSQAVKDFDAFLDALPINVGYNALIAAGMAWLIAGAAVLFTSMEVEKVTKLRADMMKIESLQPPIPVLKYTPVPKASLDVLAKKLEATYSGVKVLISGDGTITVSVPDTDYFPQFMAAVNTFENGAKNWKARFDKMCVGRDCAGSKMSAVMKIETVRVDIPPKPEDEQ